MPDQDVSTADKDGAVTTQQMEIESSTAVTTRSPTATTETTNGNPVEDKDSSEEEDDIAEYVIDRIVSHRRNEDAEHPTAKFGETVYRVRWYGYDKSDDTFEPIRHLPRNKVVSYYKKIRKELPENINQAQLG